MPWWNRHEPAYGIGQSSITQLGNRHSSNIRAGGTGTGTERQPLRLRRQREQERGSERWKCTHHSDVKMLIRHEFLVISPVTDSSSLFSNTTDLDPEPDVDRGRGWDRAGGYLGCVVLMVWLLHDSGSGSLIGVILGPRSLLDCKGP